MSHRNGIRYEPMCIVVDEDKLQDERRFNKLVNFSSLSPMMSTCLHWCRWIVCCECLSSNTTGLLPSKDASDSPKSTRYYTVRRISRLGDASSREDMESCCDGGGDGEPLATCPIETWTEPVQPAVLRGELDMLDVPDSRPQKGRWHSALNVLHPRRSRSRSRSKERKKFKVPVITFSSPDIVQDLKKEQIHIIKPPIEINSSDVDCSDSTNTHWSRTQSMQDISSKSSEDMPQSPSETDSANLARSYGINKELYVPSEPLYRKLSESQSSDTLNCNWSPEKPHPDDCFVEQPHGSVEFSAFYNHKNKKLLVHVSKVTHLPPKGGSRDYNIVAKLSVLPNEKHTKTTEVLNSSEIEEDFHFTIKEPTGRVLRISVFNAVAQGKYDAVGNALFNLEDVLSGKPRNYSMRLYKHTQPNVCAGNIHIYLKYQNQDGVISVTVDQANNLSIPKKQKHNDKYNTFVKVAFFCAGEKIKSKKSPVMASNRNPQYNYCAEFKIIPDYFDDSYVVVSVMIKGLLRKDIVVGRVILGPQFSTDGHSLTPWGQALLRQECVVHWFRMYL